MTGERQFPKTNLVIQFSPTIRQEALVWFVEKVTEIGLWIRFEPPGNDQRISLHVTADTEKFISAAQELGIRKPAVGSGRLRSITTGTVDQFVPEGHSVDDLLTSADKQLIILQELQRMRPSAPSETVPGYPLLPLPDGIPPFELYLEKKLILDYFPLHDNSELSEFEEDWIYSVVAGQPFDKIRAYFGDGISIYFAFLEFYTKLLLAPSLCGIYQFFIGGNDRKNVILVCLFNVTSGVLVGQDAWRRKCEDLSMAWNSFSEWRLVRPNFRPNLSMWEKTKTWLKINVVSAGAILAIVTLTGAIFFFSLWFQTYLEGNRPIGTIWTIADTLIVAGIGHYYTKFATFLTTWENHEQQADFEYYRVWRLVQFEFVHNFLPLFYIAFWLQDFNILQLKVNRVLLIVPITSGIKETIFPLVVYKQLRRFRSYLVRNWPGLVCWFLCDTSPAETRQSKILLSNPLEQWPQEAVELTFLEESDSRVTASRLQQDLSPYESTFDDYLEMYIQFGYVFLFAGISPYAAILAFINNFLEIRMDAWKLCRVNRRLFVKGTRDIGPWLTAFSILGFVAIFSNCAMLVVHASEDLPILTWSTAAVGAGLLVSSKLCLYAFPGPPPTHAPT